MNKQETEALQSLEASVLGSVLLRNETLAELPALEPDDFYDFKHRAVFMAMRNLEARSQPIDPVTVAAEVAKTDGHGQVIDVAFMGMLCLNVPTSDNAQEYARQVREASLSRRVVTALDGVLKQYEREALTGGELLSAALASLSRIDAEQPDSATDIVTLVQRRLKQLEQIAQERAKGGSCLTGYPTGVAALDAKMGGLQPGIVTLVAARPAMGKSSFGLAVADGVSSAGFGVHLFSMEDTEEAYADRTLSRTSEVPAENMRNAELNLNQCGEIAKAIGRLKGRKWIVDGRSGITAEEIVRSVRRHRRQNNTRVVIVDYVQLIKRPPRKDAHEALTEIITTLADAAKQDRLAYVVMSQLNRGVEARQDKRPMMSDLRESGSLEERAKCVIGLYRGAYYGKPIKGIDYDPDWEGRRFAPSEEEHAAQVQLLIIKNNNGRTGHVWATWNGPTTKIS
jgi:replicative DNA helicase